MKLKYSFLILVVGILLLAGIALFATFQSHPTLFYISECFIVLLFFYLLYFYRKTLQPYDTLIGGMELVRDLDLTTRLAPSGQYESDIIIRTFNDLLTRLRSEHLSLEEQYTFLSLLIEASPMGVVQCDLEGNITSMNPAAKQMITPAISEAMQRLPLGNETTVRLTSEPGVYRISHLSFLDRGCQHPFYLIESLTSEVRLAEKAAYERVIRMIAHEVNNSVAGIVGLMEEEAHPQPLPKGGEPKQADIPTKGHESPSLGEGLGVGQLGVGSSSPSSSLRSRLLAMSSFVTRFAEVVKIPAPQLQLCDLSEEVEACRPFLENLCLAANVRLDFHLTDDAIPVHLDPVLFQQVLVNIVKNSVESIKDSPPEPVQAEHSVPPSWHPTREGAITVAIQKLQPSNHYAPSLTGRAGGESSLTITDNGLGISPEAAQHLFTPFFSTKPQGQGLGLLLIRDILTAHGCTFTLQTDPIDHLTRFTILFPVAKP